VDLHLDRVTVRIVAVCFMQWLQLRRDCSRTTSMRLTFEARKSQDRTVAVVTTAYQSSCRSTVQTIQIYHSDETKQVYNFFANIDVIFTSLFFFKQKRVYIFLITNNKRGRRKAMLCEVLLLHFDQPTSVKITALQKASLVLLLAFCVLHVVNKIRFRPVELTSLLQTVYSAEERTPHTHYLSIDAFGTLLGLRLLQNLNTPLLPAVACRLQAQAFYCTVNVQRRTHVLGVQLS